MCAPRPRRSPNAAPPPTRLKMVREERDSFIERDTFMLVDMIVVTVKFRLYG